MTNDKLIARIPFSSISKIELYDNSSTRYTIAKVKEFTGCQYAINAGLFNMKTLQHYCNMKSNGRVLNREAYTEWGYAWNINDIRLAILPNDNYTNYIGCVCMLKDHAKETMYVNSELTGKRGRTAIATDENNFILYCTKDKSDYTSTPNTLQEELFQMGCKDALMLDGGGSAQCIFNGHHIDAERRVASLILVYTNDNNVSTITEDDSKSFIKKFQGWMNEKYNMGLSVDGSFGPASKTASVKCLQTEINRNYGGKLAIDGSFGPASKSAYPDGQIYRGVVGNIMYILQGLTYAKGFNPNGFDGSFGKGMLNAMKLFQSSNKLNIVDGTCNLETAIELLKIDSYIQ